MAVVDDGITGGRPVATEAQALAYPSRLSADDKRPGARLPAEEPRAIIAAFLRWGPAAGIR